MRMNRLGLLSFCALIALADTSAHSEPAGGLSEGKPLPLREAIAQVKRENVRRALRVLDQSGSGPWEVTLSPGTGFVSYLSGTLREGQDPVAFMQRWLGGGLFVLDPATLKPNSTVQQSRRAAGLDHGTLQVFTQTYRNLPVPVGQVTIVFHRAQRQLNVEASTILTEDFHISITPTADEQAVKKSLGIAAGVQPELGVWIDNDILWQRKPGKVVLHLAWFFRSTTGGSDVSITKVWVVDAHTGEILESHTIS